ncbi:MAG: hypothetical protein ACUVV4_04320 [Candidatus Bathyarchaeia archaeon]
MSIAIIDEDNENMKLRIRTPIDRRSIFRRREKRYGDRRIEAMNTKIATRNISEIYAEKLMYRPASLRFLCRSSK